MAGFRADATYSVCSSFLESAAGKLFSLPPLRMSATFSDQSPTLRGMNTLETRLANPRDRLNANVLIAPTKPQISLTPVPSHRFPFHRSRRTAAIPQLVCDSRGGSAGCPEHPQWLFPTALCRNRGVRERERGGRREEQETVVLRRLSCVGLYGQPWARTVLVGTRGFEFFFFFWGGGNCNASGGGYKGCGGSLQSGAQQFLTAMQGDDSSILRVPRGRGARSEAERSFVLFVYLRSSYPCFCVALRAVGRGKSPPPSLMLSSCFTDRQST